MLLIILNYTELWICKNVDSESMYNKSPVFVFSTYKTKNYYQEITSITEAKSHCVADVCCKSKESVVL
jgi:hypothetical protein